MNLLDADYKMRKLTMEIIEKNFKGMKYVIGTPVMVSNSVAQVVISFDKVITYEMMRPLEKDYRFGLK